MHGWLLILSLFLWMAQLVVALRQRILARHPFTTQCRSKLMCTISSTSPSSSSSSTCDVSTVDLKGLKAEVNRVYLRTFKKVAKASEKLAKGKIEYENMGDNPSLDLLEKLPNIDLLQQELSQLQSNLTALYKIEEDLKPMKSTKDSNFINIYKQIQVFGISDIPPPKQERGPKKEKGKAPPPRKPYNEYTSADNIIIRVGRGASDNDELTCNPEYRDNDDWWLHVSGFPGSHIVIRYTNNDLIEKYKETLYDACVLAVINSKASQNGRVPVTLTRPRHIFKPAGAKPGLVQLKGDIRVVTIDIKAEAKRISRLTTNFGQSINT